MDSWDVTVVGAGPAGLTCGRELARAGKRVRVVEISMLGGQMVNYSTLQEGPFAAEPTPAWDIVEKMMDSLMSAGGTLEFDTVQRVTPGSDTAEVEGESLGQWASRAVVLATGTTEGKLPVAGAEGFEGRGLSYCADCDAPLFKDRRVAVVGEDRLVAWEALTLAEASSEVFVLDCSREEGSRIRNATALDGRDNVTLLRCSRATGLEGQERVEALRYLPDDGSAETVLTVDGVFGASRGAAASLHLAGSVPERNTGSVPERSRFPVGSDLAVSGSPNLFAIGDARSHSPLMLSAAIGDGLQGAKSVLAYLD